MKNLQVCKKCRHFARPNSDYCNRHTVVLPEASIEVQDRLKLARERLKQKNLEEILRKP